MLEGKVCVTSHCYVLLNLWSLIIISFSSEFVQQNASIIFIEYPFGGSTARPPFCNVPVRPYRSPKWVPFFSENWHVRFEGIVRPGIILLPFGVELEARGCHFLDFPTPGPSRKQSCKKSQSREKNTLSFGSNIYIFFVTFSICCCSFFVLFWR